MRGHLMQASTPVFLMRARPMRELLTRVRTLMLEPMLARSMTPASRMPETRTPASTLGDRQ
jgi:hypothetical protein